MTNEEILQFAASMNFAHLNIDSSCCIRYGRGHWEARVPMLTAEQKVALLARIEHWEAMLAREEVQSC